MGLLSKIADCTKAHTLYECEEGSWQVFSACRCFLVDLVRPQNPRPFKFNRTHLHEGAIKIRMYGLFLFCRGVSRRRPKVKVCRSCSMKERKKGPTDDRTTHPRQMFEHVSLSEILGCFLYVIQGAGGITVDFPMTSPCCWILCWFVWDRIKPSDHPSSKLLNWKVQFWFYVRRKVCR